MSYTRTESMRAIQRWSNCLVWFAALLLPLQALQGTPAFCHLADTCCSEQPAFEVMSPDCENGCSPQLVHLEQLGTNHRHPAAAIPAGPCKCPPCCLCQNSAQPQAQTSSQTRSIPKPHMALMESAITPEIRRLDRRFDTRNASTHSAPEICVLLCRFLA